MSFQSQTDKELQLLNQLFSDESKKDHDRAVTGDPYGVEGATKKREAPPQKDQPPTDLLSNHQPWKVQDLTFLDQYVMLDDGVHAEDAYGVLSQEILREIGNGYKNYREFPEEYKIIGYHFDETRPGCYRIELFEHDEQVGVNCSRLEGDALAVSNLWTEIKRLLARANLIVDEMDLMGETDDEADLGFFSDDDESFDLDQFKYLNFSRDPSFVNRLIAEIEDINVGTHALMLFAFNCQVQNNLDFLYSNYGQEIFDKILERLGAADEGVNQNVSLPVARCAAVIICYLVRQGALTTTAQQMNCILETIAYWSQESYSTKSVTPTASEETAVLFTSILGQLKVSSTKPYDPSEFLMRIVSGTNFERVIENVSELTGTN